MSADGVSGLLVVDKPSGMTSHDVVERVREVLNTRAGHAGTLDPQATGVLLLCLGSATRLARFLQGHDKVYEGVVKFGWATDTYDGEGTAVAEPVTPPEFSRPQVEAAIAGFIGRQQQIPPVYSAKKVRGEPAYRRARRGEPVTPEPIEIEVYDAQLLDLTADEVSIEIHCGSGTYVRTLAHDLGTVLGCPAHLAGLRRTRSGSFGLSNAVTWDQVDGGSVASLGGHVLGISEMVPEWPAAVLSDDGAAAVVNGRMIEASWIVERRAGVARHGNVAAEGWVRVLAGDGKMIAAGEMVPGGLVQPRIVIR